jgi:hypothetical protein
MGEEKYLIVERYENQEIRIILDEKFDSGVLDNVCIYSEGEYIPWILNSKSSDKTQFLVQDGKPVILQSKNDLIEDDIWKVVFKDLDFIEKSIDKKNNKLHKELDYRVVYIYMTYLGKLIELYVGCDYLNNKVWYSNGASLKSVPFDEALSAIKEEFKNAKEHIDDSISKRNKRIELIVKLEEFKNDLLHKHYVKKYPELF